MHEQRLVPPNIERRGHHGGEAATAGKWPNLHRERVGTRRLRTGPTGHFELYISQIHDGERVELFDRTQPAAHRLFKSLDGWQLQPRQQNGTAQLAGMGVAGRPEIATTDFARRSGKLDLRIRDIPAIQLVLSDGASDAMTGLKAPIANFFVCFRANLRY